MEFVELIDKDLITTVAVLVALSVFLGMAVRVGNNVMNRMEKLATSYQESIKQIQAGNVVGMQRLAKSISELTTHLLLHDERCKASGERCLESDKVIIRAMKRQMGTGPLNDCGLDGLDV